MNIHCTYCWTTHNVRSLESWLDNPYNHCGKDRDRYFFRHEDYIAYVRQYEANGCQHPKKRLQISLFDINETNVADALTEESQRVHPESEMKDLAMQVLKQAAEQEGDGGDE